MMNDAPLLRLAIEDNILWCQAVCAAHGSRDVLTAGIWANLNPSPPLFPNIITRSAGSQAEVVVAIKQIRSRHPSFPLAIKDSFADLTLQDDGFECVLAGDWYGYVSERPVEKDYGGWTKVSSPDALHQWESAWNGGTGRIIFPDSLLLDERITFWHPEHGPETGAGFVSFKSASSVGLSNWFSTPSKTTLPPGALETAISNFASLPIVLWSAEDLTEDCGEIRKLGPMQVWVQPVPTQ